MTGLGVIGKTVLQNAGEHPHGTAAGIVGDAKHVLVGAGFGRAQPLHDAGEQPVFVGKIKKPPARCGQGGRQTIFIYPSPALAVAQTIDTGGNLGAKPTLGRVSLRVHFLTGKNDFPTARRPPNQPVAIRRIQEAGELRNDPRRTIHGHLRIGRRRRTGSRRCGLGPVDGGHLRRLAQKIHPRIPFAGLQLYLRNRVDQLELQAKLRRTPRRRSHGQRENKPTLKVDVAKRGGVHRPIGCGNRPRGSNKPESDR